VDAASSSSSFNADAAAPKPKPKPKPESKLESELEPEKGGKIDFDELVKESQRQIQSQVAQPTFQNEDEDEDLDGTEEAVTVIDPSHTVDIAGATKADPASADAILPETVEKKAAPLEDVESQPEAVSVSGNEHAGGNAQIKAEEEEEARKAIAMSPSKPVNVETKTKTAAEPESETAGEIGIGNSDGGHHPARLRAEKRTASGVLEETKREILDNEWAQEMARKVALASTSTAEEDHAAHAELVHLEKLRMETRLLEQRARRAQAIVEQKKKRQQMRDEHELKVRKVQSKLSKYKADVPLWKQIENNYESHVKSIKERERREALAKRRQKMAPMDMRSLLENERKYTEIMRKQSRANKLKRLQHLAVSHSETPDTTHYYRGRSRQFVMREETELSKARKREAHIQNMIRKKRQYGRLVHEMFAPSTDQRKKNEILSKLEREKERERRIQVAREKLYDKKARPWREAEPGREKKHLNSGVSRVQRQRRKQKERERRRNQKKKKQLPAKRPDYLAYACKTGKKKKAPKPTVVLEDIGKLQENVRKVEREAQTRATVLHKSADFEDNMDAAEEETELYIKVAKEKMKLLHRIDQYSR